MRQFGLQYGVDPLIFALLYFGTIPFSLLGFSWLVRNVKSRRPVFAPLLLMFFCFIGTYIYLFISGQDIPIWVYLLVLLVMFYSAFVSVRKIRRHWKRASSGSTLNE